MGVGVQRHAPADLPPGKTRYPLYRAGLDRWGSSCFHRDSIPGTPSPWRVAIPTETLGSWWGDLTETDHLEDQCVDGWIIIKLIFEKWDGEVWTGMIWLRIGTGCGRL
jgi:hypothetical protein